MLEERHQNPFFNRQRITDPAYFYGREREVESLYGAIITRQSRSIVGERKIGKSSLMTQLACPAVMSKHGVDPTQYIFLYVDLEGLSNISYDEFWPEIMDLLEQALPESESTLRGMAADLSISSNVRFTQVRRLFRRISRANLTLVMMLDEFESLARNSEFDASFYGELRSLAGEIGVVYITISKHSLYDLTYQHEDTLSSPFFNIFSEVRLNLVAEKDAQGLLDHLAMIHGRPKFSSEEIELLLELGGSHPFFLQVAGHQLYAEKQQQEETLNIDRIRRRFRAESEDHFRYLWAQLTNEEQVALRRHNSSDPDLLKLLQTKALLVANDNGRFAPFSHAFDLFLKRQDTHAARAASQTGKVDLSQSQSGAALGNTDLTGKTLGRYRVLSPIGRGGMATVYRGYQSSLDRYVAIKVMSQQLVGDQSFVERFQREAASVAQMRHQNIVQMFDFGLHDGISYMVMEFIDGDTLKDRLADIHLDRNRLPSMAEAGRVLRGIADALDYAHAHGVIHRDIKPANILLRPEEQLARLTGGVPFAAVLTDFGVARMLEGVGLTQTGATVGTPDYMSPEQASGQTATAASDIYALGIVLYEILTGERPFRGDTPIAVLLQHIDADPPSVISRVPNLPRRVDDIVNTAMAKDPTLRYTTAGMMADAFEKMVRQETVA